MSAGGLLMQVRRAGLLVGALALGAGSGPLRCQEPAALDSGALMRTVRVLAADSMEGRRAGTPGGARARRWLLSELRRIGLQPLGKNASFEHAFPLPRGQGTGVNLLGVIPGTGAPEGYLVLSAHYDHVGMRNGTVFNGADDNASGTAAVLALAEALRRQPLTHSVIVALFDGEEAGLLGAEAFLAKPPVPRAALRLNVNLDMVGHSESGELWAAGAGRHPSLRPVLEALQRRAVVRLRLGHDRPGVPGEKDWTGDSDHAVFHTAGIAFVYFGVEDHEDYHRPSDDPETLTPAFFAGAVRTILDGMRAYTLFLHDALPI